MFQNYPIPESNSDEAVEFFEHMLADQRRHLVSIPLKGRLEASTFLSHEIDKMRAWINTRQGEANLYFHVNGLRPGVANKKASKEDVSTALFVHVDRNVIRIRRIQERDGTLTEMTKTEAGTRDIPMNVTLREMLLAWRVRCPRKGKELHRVFPGPGRLQPWPKPRLGGGGPLLYQNFRKRYWAPAFEMLNLPYVTPHSARHSFISTLQAQGIEVGLVAQIAGHANPTVTLGHYTQAVRDGAVAAEALERAYGG